ncbi:MAG: DUF5615 family PIN-like protein [Pseudomonadota bacterium]
MKLLLDQNLSRYLLNSLCEVWVGSSHVGVLGMGNSSDKEIWDFSAKNDYVIVSKDNDFVQMATLFGKPPKVILLAIGNASTDAIMHCLLTHQKIINEFNNNSEEALLILP